MHHADRQHRRCVSRLALRGTHRHRALRHQLPRSALARPRPALRTTAKVKDFDPANNPEQHLTSGVILQRPTPARSSASSPPARPPPKAACTQHHDPAAIAIVTGCACGGRAADEDANRHLYTRNARVRPWPSSAPWPARAPATSPSISESPAPVLNIATACASGTHAIGLAFQMVRAGIAPAAITGGYEAPLTFGFLRAWDSMRVVSPTSCRPFSADRDGMTLGEGAAMLALEPLDSALARGARIYAEIVGFGMSADAHHITQPAPKAQPKPCAAPSPIPCRRRHVSTLRPRQPRRLHQRPRHRHPHQRRRRSRRHPPGPRRRAAHSRRRNQIPHRPLHRRRRRHRSAGHGARARRRPACPTPPASPPSTPPSTSTSSSATAPSRARKKTSPSPTPSPSAASTPSSLPPLRPANRDTIALSDRATHLRPHPHQERGAGPAPPALGLRRLVRRHPRLRLPLHRRYRRDRPRRRRPGPHPRLRRLRHPPQRALSRCPSNTPGSSCSTPTSAPPPSSPPRCSASSSKPPPTPPASAYAAATSSSAPGSSTRRSRPSTSAWSAPTAPATPAPSTKSSRSTVPSPSSPPARPLPLLQGNRPLDRQAQHLLHHGGRADRPPAGPAESQPARRARDPDFHTRRLHQKALFYRLPAAR
jgi:hypothetical protein